MKLVTTSEVVNLTGLSAPFISRHLIASGLLTPVARGVFDLDQVVEALKQHYAGTRAHYDQRNEDRARLDRMEIDRLNQRIADELEGRVEYWALPRLVRETCANLRAAIAEIDDAECAPLKKEWFHTLDAFERAHGGE